jgi:dephospho-CoA kinase
VTDHAPVPVLGLIGGVGSGKSAVARWLQGRRNVVLLDGDGIGHRVLNETAVQEKIRQRFGNAVFQEDGTVARSVLGRLVFGTSPEARRAREDLERIVHPRIREEFERHIAQARATPGVEAVILDAAVLLEAGWNELCDTIVFVDVPDEERLRRVAENRGWSREEFTRRESSQFPLTVKRRAAHAVIDNSGRVSDAGKQLERILQEVGGHSA